MAYTAGRVLVPVVPDFRGFQKSVAREGMGGGSSYQKTFGKSTGGLGGLVNKNLKRGLKVGALGATITAGLAIKGGITRLMGIEDARASLSGLGHDAKSVDKIMANALASVKGTAFGMADAGKLAATAVAAGIKPGKELTKYLKLTADTASITGSSLSEVGNAMNNVQTVGAAYNDSLQIFAQKGLPVYSLLSEELGVSTDQVKELASQGKISAETFRKVIQDKIGGAALKSGDTVRGSFANMQASLGRVGANLLSGFFPKVRGGFQGITKALGPMEGKATIVGKKLGDFASKYGPPAISVLKSVGSVIWTLATFLGKAVALLWRFKEVVLLLTTAYVAYKTTMLAVKAIEWATYLWQSRSVILGATRIAITTAMTAAQTGLNVAMTANPIGLIVAGLVLLVGGLILAYQKVGWFRAGIDALWAGIKTGFGWVKKNWPLLLVILTGPLGLAALLIIKHWGAIRAGLAAGYGWMKSNVFNPLASLIRDKIPGAFRSGVKSIGSAWDKLKSLAKTPVNFVIDTVYNNGLRKGFNNVASFLKLKTRLPAMAKVGGGGGDSGTGLRAPRSRDPHAAMGGPGDWIKDMASKGWDWTKGKIMAPVNAALAKVGSSPFAQMAGASGKKLANDSVGWLKSKFMASDIAGPMGKAGRVLRKGSYSIGMPYLGYPGHYGSDYPAATGTPVYSPWAGKVSRAMTMAGSYGKHVFIGHPGGVQTRYAHMSGYNVRAGQSVKAGQQIGRVGSTGNSTGSHLHFEYRKNGKAYNPKGLGIFDNGGWMQPGMGGVNMSSKPEPVFSDQQWATLKRSVQPVLDRRRRNGNTDSQRPSLPPIQISMPASAGPGAVAEEMLFALRRAQQGGVYARG